MHSFLRNIFCKNDFQNRFKSILLEAKVIELSIDLIFTDSDNTYLSTWISWSITYAPLVMGQNLGRRLWSLIGALCYILWMIKSKICPCSCDTGEIIGAPDGFTFALIAQQGTVLILELGQPGRGRKSQISSYCVLKAWKRIRSDSNNRNYSYRSRGPRRAVT